MGVAEKTLVKDIETESGAPVGSFWGPGAFPVRGEAEKKEGSRGGQLAPPLEVSRLCRRLKQGIYETGH